MSRSFPATGRHHRLAERLAAEERRRFSGRDAELALFRAALAGEGPAFSVLYVHGVGGSGKSALLRQYAAMAADESVKAVLLDGRIADPSAGGFLLALRDVCQLGASGMPLDYLRALDRVVLMIDSYELLMPIDSWLRETFLPQLAANTIVVMAGRLPPPPEWTADLGWAPLMYSLPLRNLRPDESREFLKERGVPDSQMPAVLAFTHGHPLALVLVADAIATSGIDTPFSPDRAPDVVGALLERIAASAPSAAHRKALELCAHVRVTNEALLGAIIEAADPHELFEWLRRLSFIEQGPEGLFPHDVAREVLDADFRWRDRDAYTDMHRRIFLHLRDRLRMASGRAQQQAFFDKLYLHRFNPIGGRYHDYGTVGAIYAEAPSSRDDATIVETVRRYEGIDSARIVAHWLRRQPDAFQVIRGVGGELLGSSRAWQSTTVGPRIWMWIRPCASRWTLRDGMAHYALAKRSCTTVST